MLLYEQLHTFMVRPKYAPEPVERFIKRHFPLSAYKIIGIRYYFFFRLDRQIVFLRQPEPHSLDCRNAGADMPFNDVKECFRKTETLRDLHPCDSMPDTVRPGPADIVEQTALPYEFPVNGNRYPVRN